MNFDVETAIKVCRSAGYYSHALSLAQKHQQHTWYLKVQLEDIKDYQTALEYMGKLSFEEVSYSTDGTVSLHVRSTWANSALRR